MSLLTLAKQKQTLCAAVDAWARRKLESLDIQIKTLTRLRNELKQRWQRWSGRLPCPPMSPDEICCLIEELPSPQERR